MRTRKGYGRRMQQGIVAPKHRPISHDRRPVLEPCQRCDGEAMCGPYLCLRCGGSGYER